MKKLLGILIIQEELKLNALPCSITDKETSSFFYLLYLSTNLTNNIFLEEIMKILCLLLIFKIIGSESFKYNSSKIQPGWRRNPTLVRLHNDLLKAGFDSRIVGGNEVEPHSYPHQVAIFIDGFYFCGGSLIGIHYIEITLDSFQINLF